MSRTMEGFCFMICVIGLNKHNSEKEDDDDKLQTHLHGYVQKHDTLA
jgi:hypothetical protein